MHFIEVLVELSATDDPKVLIKQGAMQSLDDAVALRAPDLGCAMFDFLELEEELERMVVGTPTVLSAVVA